MSNKRGANGFWGWYKLRWQILERDNFTCQYCGQSAPNTILEVDHKINVSDGGSDDPSNLITSCWSCNRGKNAFIQSIALKARRLDTSKRSIRIQPLLREVILNTLKGNNKPMKFNEIARLIDKNSDSVRVTLYRMRDSGLVNLKSGAWNMNLTNS